MFITCSEFLSDLRLRLFDHINRLKTLSVISFAIFDHFCSFVLRFFQTYTALMTTYLPTIVTYLRMVLLSNGKTSSTTQFYNSKLSVSCWLNLQDEIELFLDDNCRKISSETSSRGRTDEWTDELANEWTDNPPDEDLLLSCSICLRWDFFLMKSGKGILQNHRWLFFRFLPFKITN